MSFYLRKDEDDDFQFDPNKDIDESGATNNGERANRGEEAVVNYAAREGMPNFDDPSCVQDLLSDIFHYCDRQGHDTHEVLRMAINRWEEER